MWLSFYLRSDQQRLPVRFIDDEKVFFSKSLADVENDGIRSALYSGGLQVIEVESPAFLDYLLVEQLIILPQNGKKPIESVVNVLNQYYPGYKIEYINCEQLSEEGISLQDVIWQSTQPEGTGKWEELFEKKYKEFEEQLLKEMSAIDQADDGLNPIVKKKGLFFEFCKRRNSLTEKYIPTTPMSPNKRRLLNSFKEHVLKEFYYEWKADDVNQKYLKNKVTHFMLRDVPRLRSEHRIYMQTKDSNYHYDFQPEYIDASTMKIVEMIAEYTAYQDVVSGLEILTENSSMTKKETKNITFTRAQQALAYYHIIINLGIDKNLLYKRSLVSLMHLLSFESIPTNLDNSHLYTALKKMFLSGKKKLITDLQVVLGIFEELSQFNSSIIDKIIEDLEKEIKDQKKSKNEQNIG